MSDRDSSLSVSLELDRQGFRLSLDTELELRGITGIFGPSGAGKTTLLRFIAGLEPDGSGRLRVGDEVWADSSKAVSRPAHRREVGYVFQEPRLFPHLSVQGNLDYGRKRNAGEAVDYDATVSLLDISALLERKPLTLSGGEAQRVAIARALLRSPRLLLMDEPLASLDAARKAEILPYLDRLHAELDVPVLYVSHSLDEVCRLCDQLLVLRGGSVLANGPIQSVLASLDSASIGGAVTVVVGEVLGYDERFDLSHIRLDGGDMQVAGRHETGARLRLIIRAADVSLCREQPLQTTILNVLPVTIREIAEGEGAVARVVLDCGRDTIIATITRRSVADLSLARGEQVFAQVKSVSVRAASA